MRQAQGAANPVGLAVALDTADPRLAAEWAAAVAPVATTIKVGLELYLSAGLEAVADICAAARDCSLFLDLKLHDIPHTVSRAVNAVAEIKPAFLTVHASGGGDMICAAVESLPETAIAAVTVLTSLSEQNLVDVGIRGPAEDAVLRLAELAVANGARALVCSPHELRALRTHFGQDVVLITPGVRPAGSAHGDQSRVATPEQAAADGASLVVVGRPITAAADPAAAAAAIVSALRATHEGTLLKGSPTR